MEAQELASEPPQDLPSTLSRTTARRRNAGGVEESRARGSGKQAAVYDDEDGEEMDPVVYSSSSHTVMATTQQGTVASPSQKPSEAHSKFTASQAQDEQEEAPDNIVAPKRNARKSDKPRRITKLDGMDTFGRGPNVTDGLLDPDANLTKSRRAGSERDGMSAINLDLDEGSLLRAEAKLAPLKAKAASQSNSKVPARFDKDLQDDGDATVAEGEGRRRGEGIRGSQPDHDDEEQDRDGGKEEEVIEEEDPEIAQERADRLQLERELMLLRAELTNFDENSHSNVSQQRVVNNDSEKRRRVKRSQVAPVVRQDISSSEESDEQEQEKAKLRPARMVKKIAPQRSSKDRTFESDSESEMRPLSPKEEEVEVEDAMSRLAVEEENARLPTPKNLKSVKKSDLLVDKRDLVSQARKQKFERMQNFANEKVHSHQDQEAILYNDKVAQWSKREEQSEEEESEDERQKREEEEEEEREELERSVDIKGAQVCAACGEPNRPDDKYCSCGEILPYGHEEEETQEEGGENEEREEKETQGRRTISQGPPLKLEQSSKTEEEPSGILQVEDGGRKVEDLDRTRTVKPLPEEDEDEDEDGKVVMGMREKKEEMKNSNQGRADPASAIEEADALLVAFAPPKRSEEVTFFSVPKREAEDGMDPFLLSLGMPKRAPKAKWGEGREEREGGKERSSSTEGSLFKGVNESLLTKKEETKMRSSVSGGQGRRGRSSYGSRGEESFSSRHEETFDSHATSSPRQSTGRLSSSMTAAVMDPAVIRALREAKALLDENVLTEEEFRMQKEIILARGYAQQQQQQQAEGRPYTSRSWISDVSVQAMEPKRRVVKGYEEESNVFVIRPELEESDGEVTARKRSEEKHVKKGREGGEEEEEEAEGEASMVEGAPHSASQTASPIDRLASPLFLRDYNAEVERLRKEAEQELAQAEEEGDDDEDEDGRRWRRREHANQGRKKPGPEQVKAEKQEAEDNLDEVTDDLIEQAWKHREQHITNSVAEKEISLRKDFPISKSLLKPKTTKEEPVDQPHREGQRAKAPPFSQRQRTAETQRKSVKFVDPDLQSEQEEGWGSDVSSDADLPLRKEEEQGRPQTHQPSQRLDEQIREEPPQEQEEMMMSASAQFQSSEEFTNKFDSEAERLEREALMLQLAAEEAEKEKRRREEAEQEAAHAREEVERLRKQLEALDDRVKATEKMEKRQKGLIAKSVLDDIIESALQLSSRTAADRQEESAEEEKEGRGMEAEDQKAWEEERGVRGRDENVDEVDGEAELRLWETQHSMRRNVRFNVEEKEKKISRGSQGHTPRTEERIALIEQIDLQKARNASQGRNEDRESISTARERKVVSVVDPCNISSSDDDDEEQGEGQEEEEEEEEEEDLSELDPELLLRLQILSAVLIQRTYRRWRARNRKANTRQIQDERHDAKASSPQVADVNQVVEHGSEVQEDFAPVSPLDEPADAGEEGGDFVAGEEDGREEEAGIPPQNDTEGQEEEASTSKDAGDPAGTREPAREKEHATSVKQKEEEKRKKKILREVKQLFQQAGFNDVAEVFVFFERGTSRGDSLSVQEVERGLKNLRMEGKIRSSELLHAMNIKESRETMVTFNEFFRHLSWDKQEVGEETQPRAETRPSLVQRNTAELEEARKNWRRTADRIRKCLALSSSLEEDRSQQEARKQLLEFRTKIGKNGVPFSARGSRTFRGSGMRRNKRVGEEKARGFLTDRNVKKKKEIPRPERVNRVERLNKKEEEEKKDEKQEEVKEEEVKEEEVKEEEVKEEEVKEEEVKEEEEEVNGKGESGLLETCAKDQTSSSEIAASKIQGTWKNYRKARRGGSETEEEKDGQSKDKSPVEMKVEDTKGRGDGDWDDGLRTEGRVEDDHCTIERHKCSEDDAAKRIQMSWSKYWKAKDENSARLFRLFDVFGSKSVKKSFMVSEARRRRDKSVCSLVTIPQRSKKFQFLLRSSLESFRKLRHINVADLVEVCCDIANLYVISAVPYHQDVLSYIMADADHSEGKIVRYVSQLMDAMKYVHDLGFILHGVETVRKMSEDMAACIIQNVALEQQILLMERRENSAVMIQSLARRFLSRCLYSRLSKTKFEVLAASLLARESRGMQDKARQPSCQTRSGKEEGKEGSLSRDNLSLDLSKIVGVSKASAEGKSLWKGKGRVPREHEEEEDEEEVVVVEEEGGRQKEEEKGREEVRPNDKLNTIHTFDQVVERQLVAPPLLS
ncbi:hypothetical protein GUITHDRAFT_133200 [Guillardia theta CCMP2712]|uniref:Protein kinase domain-containing protein n=3 Tax=Guillardia theta TaxID=55529 RepID=L1JY47_GUITC|nr:hypothetical protein GUITHDRAFT_133200 [Guillardia theta CCMP2712]EKX53501.1 hypothetical protein GUITHDRAFT_133200 [Guillardia theta CCMP2712]|eukprot:XP_005840481.1 hypothetical protein GUITHDRAFT_133200 [Guillardia theta CCMP2712]